ncbi:hypothetical protein Amir_4759 [Actinosynnema mirum DSM 43827]|uniref:Uncharacterized protein n=1 Tax=Actinosynnema mirum (strain ATCC 29888 / DSM 43827 / JCM 3225 / NBRC 14064 / NCIMB 13271 / NRRL B-12336 / IMRU 3971 / 101) TaxID=446462 RepID=C6WP86_ACTMD|nr:hypothetical protein Amir_4759 [Actinosynnema mirum DSM 43827]
MVEVVPAGQRGDHDASRECDTDVGREVSPALRNGWVITAR